MTTEYHFETLEELDNFDPHDAYWSVGEDFSVYVEETKETYFPVFGKDGDGFEGWK